ncbi:hypothetical protein HJFPF1_07215 [Paramyrothecium foliicola]|nr:hypothetical protein HJFPF1_07215 [Paramyrothecium foliicola]
MEHVQDYSGEDASSGSFHCALPYDGIQGEKHQESSFVSVLDDMAWNLAAWQDSLACVESLTASDTSWDFEETPVVSAAHELSAFPRRSPSRSKDTASPGIEYHSPPKLQNCDLSESLDELQRINLDLHARLAAVELHKDAINLDMMLYQYGPLFINDRTVAEFTLEASREFLHVLGRLRNKQMEANLAAAARPTPPPLAATYNPRDSPFHLTQWHGMLKPSNSSLPLVIVSIFTQLIILYELNVREMTRRIDAMDAPVLTIPGLDFGRVMDLDPRLQGLLFSEAVLNFLERMERSVGVTGSRAGLQGLLSPKQLNVLWSELADENGQSYYDSQVRLVKLKESFQDARMNLRRICILESIE